MSKKTEPYDACAASVQTIGTKAEFQTDLLMQNLSRENLNELFPGAEHLKLRKTIYEILHNQKQTHQFLKNLEDFVQQDSLNDAALTKYLHRINNIKDDLDEMQTVLEAHVKMQEDINKSQVSQKEPEVQTDSGIQTKTPQEEPNEQLAGQDDRNDQKPTSRLQEERGEVTYPDSPRDVQTDSEIQTPQEGHHEPSAGQDDLNDLKPTSQIQEERGEVTKQDSPRASSTKDETVLTMLQEIQKNNPKAASVLKDVGIQTDSEIKSLTPEDLIELFPDNLEFRKIIFEIIHKKPTDQVLGELDVVAQRKFLIDECLKKITYLKNQLNEALTEAHVNTSENFWNRLDFKKDPHFQTDPVFQTLTREGLQKFFPGRNNFKLRKTMFEILHNLPNDLLLGESGDVTQQSSAEGYSSDSTDPTTTNEKQNKGEKGSDPSGSRWSILSLSGSSQKPSDDRDKIKDQLDRMMAVIKKGYSPDSTAPTTTNEKQNKGEKGSDGSSQRWSLPNRSVSSKDPSVTVKYKMVVSGQTFGAHLQILDQIKASGLNLIEINDVESCIIIIFCPVVSRIGTDAEAAMKKVPGDVPVILVLMHYSQEPKHVSSSKVLTSYSNVVLEVNIYHDRKNGLLVCEQNRNAVIELRKTLNNYRTPSTESNRKGQIKGCASS